MKLLTSIVAAMLLSACDSAPVLQHLECSNTLSREAYVFDRNSGQLYTYSRERDTYWQKPDHRFSIKTTGRIDNKSLVIETRVGEWKGDIGDRNRIWRAISPRVGNDLFIDLNTLMTSRKSYNNMGRDMETVYGRCRWTPLKTENVEVSTLKTVARPNS